MWKITSPDQVGINFLLLYKNTLAYYSANVVVVIAGLTAGFTGS
jgi:hypothetical protein